MPKAIQKRANEYSRPFYRVGDHVHSRRRIGVDTAIQNHFPNQGTPVTGYHAEGHLAGMGVMTIQVGAIESESNTRYTAPKAIDIHSGGHPGPDSSTFRAHVQEVLPEH